MSLSRIPLHLVVFLAGGIAHAAETPQPFFDLRSRQTEYHGPGREAEELADVAEVRLGYFGPSDPTDPDGGDCWRAAELAIDEANRAGGYRGKPFRLVPGWSDQPWKSGAVQVTRMVYVDKVWAIIGGPDGTTTHLAEQVAAKGRVPIVSPGNMDRTTNLANVAWMFSLLPGDHLQASSLTAAMAQQLGERPFVILSADDRDAKQFVVQLVQALERRHMHPSFQYACSPMDEAASQVIAKSIEVKPFAIVVVADAQGSSRLVKGLRERGFAGRLYGSASMGRNRFHRDAGLAAEGAVFPRLDSDGPNADAFRKAFEERYHRRPDFASAAAYDAVRLLVAAVRKAGLNRSRIGDAIRDASPWPGASGLIEWDRLGGNSRPVRLGVIRPLSASGASEPSAIPLPGLRPQDDAVPDHRLPGEIFCR